MKQIALFSSQAGIQRTEQHHKGYFWRLQNVRQVKSVLIFNFGTLHTNP